MTTMPKMNLWIDAFNSDTCFLSDEELGIYFRLIFFAWSRGGYLPDDMEFIYCLSRSGNEQKIDKIIKLFWTKDEQGYYQKRLREEYQRAVAVTERNRANGKLNLGMPNESQNQASISKSISISKSKKININNPAFEKFWDNVCYKIAKGQARINFNRLDETLQEKGEWLAELYNKYYMNLADKKFAQHPSTWLSAERFLDTTDKKIEQEDTEQSEKVLRRSRYDLAKKQGRPLYNMSINEYNDLVKEFEG